MTASNNLSDVFNKVSSTDSNLKNINVNVLGEIYRFYQTPDRRWYEVHNGKVRKTSGNHAKTMIWAFGDRSQRLQERRERQQLFERLRRKRERQLNTEYEESDIRRYFQEEVVI
jgi:hypothetical protein